jgi:hypothetical protein
LSFNSDSNLGACKIKFGGAVELGVGASPSTSDATDASANQSSNVTNALPEASQSTDQNTGKTGSKNKTFVFSILDAVGQHFNIPTTGKLRVEMKDGSVQEIDLTQVKSIQVKQ